MRGSTLIILFASGALLVAVALLGQGAKGKTGDPIRGKEVFAQCAVCHHATSTEKKMGPGLKGLFKRTKLSNGKRVSETNVRAVIETGGNGMPAYKELLSEQEKADVVAYLKTL